MKQLIAGTTFTLLLLGGIQGPVGAASGGLSAVERAQLCVTEGSLQALSGTRLGVSDTKMRAYLGITTPADVEAEIHYLGGTTKESRLGSGEIRRQLGLKLRAQDACNLVYVMWRIEPESKLVVSVKTNPGEHTSGECGNRGYRNVKARHSGPLPVLRPGDSHRLAARMHGSEVTVLIDGRPVWEGSVGPLSFDGPVGIRSDNARFEFALWARIAGHQTASCAAGAAGAD